ncbi:hypothetical protein Tco_0025727, partial [Tanacetum coccineum]
LLYCPGVLGGDTSNGSTYSLNKGPGVLGGDTWDTGNRSTYSLNKGPGVLGGDTCNRSTYSLNKGPGVPSKNNTVLPGCSWRRHRHGYAVSSLMDTAYWSPE